MKLLAGIGLSALALVVPLTGLQAAALGAFEEQSYQTEKLKIDFIDVQGGHLFPEAWLVEVLAEYEGRELTIKELEALQTQLTNFYLQRGYVGSGVVIPEQEITGNVLVMNAVHARLTRINNYGNKELSNRYINENLRPSLSVPVNIGKLNQSLAMLKEHQLVDDVDARFVPGNKLGDAVLHLEVKERSAHSYGMSLDNYQSPSIGSYRLSANVGHYSFLGLRDRLNIEAGVTEGLKDYAFTYQLPLTLHDLSLHVSARGSDYSIIEEPFDAADIQSRSRQSALSLHWPVKRNFYSEATLFAGVDRTETTNTAFEIIEEEANTVAAQLGLKWQWRREKQAWAFQLMAERGVDTGNATIHEGRADGVYQLASVHSDYQYRIGSTVRLQWRLASQKVNEAVLPAKRFAIGGVRSVRGYRQNQFVRDNGVQSTLALHWQLSEGVSLSPFFDYGQVQAANGGLYQSSDEEVYSAGLGLSWKSRAGFDAQLNWGHALVDKEAKGDDPQDEGVYLRVAYQY
jgi:hemolysin activation/secretion protein